MVLFGLLSASFVTQMIAIVSALAVALFGSSLVVYTAKAQELVSEAKKQVGMEGYNVEKGGWFDFLPRMWQGLMFMIYGEIDDSKFQSPALGMRPVAAAGSGSAPAS